MGVYEKDPSLRMARRGKRKSGRFGNSEPKPKTKKKPEKGGAS